MANLKSSKKSIRQIKRRTQRNKHTLSTLKTLAKKVKQAVQSGNAVALQNATKSYVSALDKAVKRNIIHSNKANRHKSVVSKHLFTPIP